MHSFLKRAGFACVALLTLAVAASAFDGPTSPASQNVRACSWIGQRCLHVNQDGSLNVNTAAPTAPASNVAVGGCTQTVNTAYTLTLTPPDGQFVYLTSLYISVTGDGTGSTQTVTAFTSTNLGATWEYATTSATQVNVRKVIDQVQYTPPVRSIKQGVPVTFVSPSAVAQNAYCIRATYYFAP